MRGGADERQPAARRVEEAADGAARVARGGGRLPKHSAARAERDSDAADGCAAAAERLWGGSETAQSEQRREAEAVQLQQPAPTWRCRRRPPRRAHHKAGRAPQPRRSAAGRTTPPARSEGAACRAAPTDRFPDGSRNHFLQGVRQRQLSEEPRRRAERRRRPTRARRRRAARCRRHPSPPSPARP